MQNAGSFIANPICCRIQIQDAVINCKRKDAPRVIGIVRSEETIAFVNQFLGMLRKVCAHWRFLRCLFLYTAFLIAYIHILCINSGTAYEQIAPSLLITTRFLIVAPL